MSRLVYANMVHPKAAEEPLVIDFSGTVPLLEIVDGNSLVICQESGVPLVRLQNISYIEPGIPPVIFDHHDRAERRRQATEEAFARACAARGIVPT